MKTAIITGATQGIGKAIAEKFLQNDFSIAVCARTATHVTSLVKEWMREFPNAQIVGCKADLGIKQERMEFVEKVQEHFVSVDVLVNNAGLFFPGKLMEEPEGHLEKLMEVNLYSAYHLTRHFLTQLKKSNKAHIFNISSVAGLRAYENGGAYGITKYALLGFSDNLRMELMDENIRVTAVVPGATWSRSWENSGVDKARLMQPEDIAESIWSAYGLSKNANVDHIVIRPLKGDI